jgi:cell shape-determining protein MreC
MGVSTFLVMLLSFTGAAVTVIWVIVLAIGHIKRQAARLAPGQPTSEELEELRARLAELERRDVRVEEIEERLDFVERMLGRAREAKPLRNPAERE